MKRVYAFLLLLLIFNGALAAEIFVSPTGSDANAGTREKPFKSIKKAVSKANAGDTVRLLPGLYQENVTISRSGTKEKPLRISGSRGADGMYLAIIEPAGQQLNNWAPAPEIGENVWKTQVKNRPNLVLMDGRMIVQINRYNMQIKRRKPLPDKLTEELVWGDWNPKTSKRLSGLDLLAVKKDILVTHRYFRARINGKNTIKEELFFPVVGNVLCGWLEGTLYVRFANGSSPEKHKFTASYGSGLELKNVSNVILSDLFLRGSTIQVNIQGKSKNVVVENSLLMHGARRIKIEKTASDITVRNNILTSGFVQTGHFGQPLELDKRGRLLYLIFKYIVGTATSDDAGVEFFGSNCRIYDNVIYDGLLGIDGGGPGAEVYGNSIRNMSSCGIITGNWSSGRYYRNLVVNSGIPLRIHDWRHYRFYRTEYHYCNLFIQAPYAGSQVHIYSGSHRVGQDAVNYDKNGIYKENPPAPFDPGKIFIYHNTFLGGSDSSTLFPAKTYFKRFRGKPIPFYFVINIIKSTWAWDMSHQDMLAGNLFFISKKPFRRPTPHDKTVKDFNRINPTEKMDSIWKDLYAENLPDIRLAAESPALGCGWDLSREQSFRGVKVPALPGCEPGYFTGKAPAAGALQANDDELMEHFRKLNDKMLKAQELVKKQR